MSDLTYLIILRLIHITCGIFWAGATIYLAVFVIPAVKASGAEGSKFMQQLSRTNRLPLVMMLAATLTVLAGILLIWKISGGLQSEWMGSKHGIVLSTGAALTIIAYLIGLTVNRPVVAKIAAMGKAIAAQGAPPSPEQMQQLGILRKRLFTATNIVALLLAFTVIIMSIIRYI
jgi:uncharacterized membrane protein